MKNLIHISRNRKPAFALGAVWFAWTKDVKSLEKCLRARASGTMGRYKQRPAELRQHDIFYVAHQRESGAGGQSHAWPAVPIMQRKGPVCGDSPGPLGFRVNDRCALSSILRNGNQVDLSPKVVASLPAKASTSNPSSGDHFHLGPLGNPSEAYKRLLA